MRDGIRRGMRSEWMKRLAWSNPRTLWLFETEKRLPQGQKCGVRVAAQSFLFQLLFYFKSNLPTQSTAALPSTKANRGRALLSFFLWSDKQIRKIYFEWPNTRKRKGHPKLFSGRIWMNSKMFQFLQTCKSDLDQNNGVMGPRYLLLKSEGKLPTIF